MQIFWIVCATFIVSSCSALSHLDEALVLKDYSDNKDTQVAYVKSADRRFEALMERIKKGDTFKPYNRKSDFIAKFGEPVLAQPVKLSEGREGQRLLYRYATQYFEGPKVYVFFDESGQLLRIEHDGLQ